MSLAGAYFAVGALLFLAVAIADAFALCCGRRRADKAEGAGCCGGCCSAVFSPRIWYVLAVIVALAGTATALAQIGVFKSTVNTTVSGLERFNDLLGNTSRVVANGLTPALSNVSVTSAALYSYAQSQGAPQQVLNDIANLQSQAATAATTSDSVSSQLNSTANSLNQQLKNGHTDIDRLGDRIFIGGVASLACFLALLLLSTLGLIPNKCGAIYFYACNWLLVPTLLLVFVFAGIFIAVSIVSADVCYAPSTSLVAIATLAKPGPDALATLGYYTTCGLNSTIAPAGAFANVLNASTGINTALASVAALEATVGSGNGYSPYLQSLTTQLQLSQSSVSMVTGLTNCTNVFPIYDDMITALCTKGGVAIATVWALGTAGALLMIIIVISAARLVWNHPGAVEAEATIRGGFSDWRGNAVGAPHVTPNPVAVVAVHSGSPAAYAAPDTGAGSGGGVSDWRTTRRY